jgi:biotin carboxyl carrier protein
MTMSETNIIMNIDGTDYTTNTTPSFERKKKWAHPDDRIVTSIIPGTIVEIFVKENESVQDGGAMLVIEAMKMNNQIKFGRNGIVDKILVKPGDIVTKGQSLMILK